MFYPIELDKLTNQLEKTEKKIKEADHGIYVAKDEIQNLNRNIADKEIQLKINEQNFGPKSAALTKESAKYAFTLFCWGGLLLTSSPLPSCTMFIRSRALTL